MVGATNRNSGLTAQAGREFQVGMLFPLQPRRLVAFHASNVQQDQLRVAEHPPWHMSLAPCGSFRLNQVACLHAAMARKSIRRHSIDDASRLIEDISTCR
jgi:hypothetical protein